MHRSMEPPLPPVDEYEKIAPFYDALLEPFLEPLRRDVCRAAKDRGCTSLLDICCGTGRQLVLLHRLGFSVAGVDLSAAMLRVARSRSPEGIAYYHEDASDLHFEDASFDCVILSFALHEKEPSVRDRIVEEAKRVLRSGGTMILVDYIQPRGLPAKISSALIHVIERLAGRNHYRNFRSFMEEGALGTTLRTRLLSPILVRKHHLGATALVVARPDRTPRP